MLCCKKINTKQKESDLPIDFAWIYIVGMRMGFRYAEVRHMRFGTWADMFDAYKQQYNFETKRILYNLQEEEPISSLSVL